MKFNLVPITNIKKYKYSGPVYDLEVGDPHSYIAEGMVVHNSVCVTTQRTGVGHPQLGALHSCYDEIVRQGLPIKMISDGGITSSGDVAKALKYADAVMVGAVLAGTTETPGNVYPEPGTNLVDRRYYKMYGGSASMENKVSSGLKNEFVEGEMLKVPFKGHAKYILREIEHGLKSAFSYVNAMNLQEFRNNCELEYV